MNGRQGDEVKWERPINGKEGFHFFHQSFPKRWFG